MSPVFKAVIGGIGSGSISIAERSKQTLLKVHRASSMVISVKYIYLVSGIQRYEFKGGGKRCFANIWYSHAGF
jgi:hypothetical protein